MSTSINDSRPSDITDPTYVEVGGEELLVVATDTFDQTAEAQALYKSMDRTALLRYIAQHANEGIVVHDSGKATVRKLRVEGKSIMYFQIPGTIYLMAILNGDDKAASSPMGVARLIMKIVDHVSSLLKTFH